MCLYAPRCRGWDEPARGGDWALDALGAPARCRPGAAGVAGAGRRRAVAGGARRARAADRGDRVAAGVWTLAGGGAAAPVAAALAGDLAGVRGAAGRAGRDRLLRRDDGGGPAWWASATGAAAAARWPERRALTIGAAAGGFGHPARSD